MLTRYLYCKKGVEYSLVVALMEGGNLDECYFWLDELIGSGFQVDQLLWRIFYDFYFEHHPKLEAYLRRHVNSAPFRVIRQLYGATWSDAVYRDRTARAAPLSLDELAYQYDGSSDVSRYWKLASTYDDEEHRLYAMEAQLKLSSDQLMPQTYYIRGAQMPRSPDISGLLPRQVLSNTRVYTARMKSDPQELYKWEYYAFETPIWNERFRRFNASANHTTKRVEFATDEDLEAFYDAFGYEPDEQSKLVQEKSHLMTNSDKIEINGLCYPYE